MEPTWVILIAVVVILFFVVVVIGIGLTIFFIMRKRSKAQRPPNAALSMSSDYSPSDPAFAEPADLEAALPEVAGAIDTPPPSFAAPLEEISADAAEASPAEAFAPEAYAPPANSGSLDFDPTRTVAINREPTVAISYGAIKFVSGILAGQQFDVNPEGSYIGRESSLSQIVVSDPRISKRHLWIGVKDGQVKIVDSDSRNGTFVNDPKSERITEATLNNGDTVILGESDVARFEYQG
jgi:hypothetical protein